MLFCAFALLRFARTTPIRRQHVVIVSEEAEQAGQQCVVALWFMFLEKDKIECRARGGEDIHATF